MSKRRHILLGSLAGLVLCGVAVTLPPMKRVFTVEGVVCGPSGKGLPGARVRLSRVEKHPEPRPGEVTASWAVSMLETATDPDGRFELSDRYFAWRRRSYEVSATHVGCSTPVTIVEGPSPARVLLQCNATIGASEAMQMSP